MLIVLNEEAASNWIEFGGSPRWFSSISTTLQFCTHSGSKEKLQSTLIASNYKLTKCMLTLATWTGRHRSERIFRSIYEYNLQYLEQYCNPPCIPQVAYGHSFPKIQNTDICNFNRIKLNSHSKVGCQCVSRKTKDTVIEVKITETSCDLLGLLILRMLGWHPRVEEDRKN